MLKTFDIKLDIEKDLYSPMQILFNVSNNDVDSVQLNFEILQDDNPFDLTGKTIQLAIQNPSRQVVYIPIEITGALEGKASARLSQNAYLQEGIHVSEVYISDVDQTIVTSPFYFNSWASITTQETVPTDPTTGDVYWQNVLNKPLTFPPSAHNHPMSEVVGLLDALDSKANVGETGGGEVALPIDITDVTGLQSALDGKVDDAQMTTKSDVGHVHTINQVTGLQNALDSKVDDAEMSGKANLNHQHAIQDITGLQIALDGKADDSELALKMNKADAYLKTETYAKSELYNRTEIDQMTMGEGGGSPVIVEDNLLSTSPTNALSSNQGRILNVSKADADHNHTSADITDFGTAVAGAIPLEYMTQSEGDGRYQAIGTIPAHTHDEYLTPTEADALYQPVGTIPVHDHPEYLTSIEADALFLTQTEGDGRYQPIDTVPVHDHPEYLTSVPAEYLTQTEGDGRYQAIGTVPTHSHPEYLTSVPAEYLTQTEGDGRYLQSVPAEYLTQTEGDGRYQAIGVVPTHTHTKANITDFAHTHTEADITFGVKNAKTYVDDADNYILNTRMAGLTLWKGTQAAYDLLTKDPNTLYFIVG